MDMGILSFRMHRQKNNVCQMLSLTVSIGIAFLLSTCNVGDIFLKGANMKQKIKTGLFLAACVVCVSILWRHTHLKFEPKQDKTDHTQTAKDEKTQAPEFPATYKENVSKHLLFDATVDTGNADVGRIGCRTAIMQKFEEESMKKSFLDPDVTYDVQKGREIDWEETDVISTIYEKEGVSLLSVWETGVQYSKIPLMMDVNDLMSAAYGLKGINYQYQFSKDLELDGFSRLDAWEKVVGIIEKLGMEQGTLKIADSYTLDVVSMDKQEKKLIKQGNIDKGKGHGKWRRREEGYFFFIEECVDGLPLVPAKTLTDMGNSWGYPTNQIVYVTRDGIAGLHISNWFEVGEDAGYYTLAAFHDIVEALESKYENQLTKECVCIEKMKLYLYPISRGKGSFQLYPVWICTARMRMSEKDKIGREERIALDAVTGEELEELQ